MSQRNHAANADTAMAHRMKTRNVIVCEGFDVRAVSGIEPRTWTITAGGVCVTLRVTALRASAHLR